MRSTEIDNSWDIIDSREIIKRIQELEDAETLTPEDIPEDEDIPEEVAELKALKDLQEEAEGYSEDWQFGSQLIRDSYFEEYAQELAEDIGAIDRNANWPLSHIDWKAAADHLKQDYTSVEFDGVEYWIR